MENQKCSICKNEFPATLEYFGKHGSRGLDTYCKDCRHKKTKQYYYDNNIYLDLYNDLNNKKLQNRKIIYGINWFKIFYNHYAVSQRQHINKDAFAVQLKTNPHPMDKYRTNCPLARTKMFKDIYRVKKGDEMYWYESNMIW